MFCIFQFAVRGEGRERGGFEDFGVVRLVCAFYLTKFSTLFFQIWAKLCKTDHRRNYKHLRFRCFEKIRIYTGRLSQGEISVWGFVRLHFTMWDNMLWDRNRNFIFSHLISCRISNWLSRNNALYLLVYLVFVVRFKKFSGYQCWSPTARLADPNTSKQTWSPKMLKLKLVKV